MPASARGGHTAATTTATAGHAGPDGSEVVKWFTRARRFPQLIGKTPDGMSLWGGPYTFTQVIAGVGILVVGAKTTGLWGHFGLVGNAVVLLAVTYGSILLLGRLPIGARSPLSIAAGAVQALTAPPQGRHAGVPVRPRRPRRARSHVVITTLGPGRAPLQVEATAAAATDPGRPPLRAEDPAPAAGTTAPAAAPAPTRTPSPRRALRSLAAADPTLWKD